MKRRSILVIIAMVILLIITGCSYVKEEEETVKNRFKEEYESINGKEVAAGSDKTYRSVEIPEDNPFVYTDANDIITRMDNGETFVVYFGFAKCPWCRSVLPTLIEVAEELGLKTIYYVDVSEIRDVYELNENEAVMTKEGSEGYIGLLKRLDSVLDEYTLINDDGEEIEVGEKRIYAPNVVSIVDGQTKELETGISDLQDDAYMELTEDMKKDTYNKFKCSIKCVLENKNVCSSKNAC